MSSTSKRIPVVRASQFTGADRVVFKTAEDNRRLVTERRPPTLPGYVTF